MKGSKTVKIVGIHGGGIKSVDEGKGTWTEGQQVTDDECV